MSQIVDEVLPGHPAGILAGPNIAREVADGYAAAAVLAMPDQHLAARLAELFRTRRFRTYTTDDVVGVEMAGALKNVYAIAVGMGYSLGIGENTRAMVMARAVREMSKMGEAAGGHRDTFAGLAGIGDLIVTCTSQRSRNRHVGEQLGAGKSIDEIIASMNQVAEGVKAASVIMEFAEKYGLSMPIAREVDGVINHGATLEDAYARPGGREARPRGPRRRFLDAYLLVVHPKGRAKCALSGEAWRRSVGDDDDVLERQARESDRRFPRTPMNKEQVRWQLMPRLALRPPHATCRRTRPTTRTWKILAWTGPVFLAAFFCLWGLLADNIPPFPPSATPDEVWQHYADLRLPIMIGDERLPHDGRLLHVVERGDRPGDGTYRGSRRSVVQARDDGRHDHVCAPHGGLRDLAHRRTRDRQHRSRHRAHALLVWLAADRLGVLRHLVADRRRQHRVHARQAGEEAGPGRRQLVGLGHLRVVLRRSVRSRSSPPGRWPSTA